EDGHRGPAGARAPRRRAPRARRLAVHRLQRPGRGGRPHRALRQPRLHRARLPRAGRRPAALPRAVHPRRAAAAARALRVALQARASRRRTISARMIGRERELEALLAAPTALLEGEAGIGKSTLWAEVVARSPVRVLRARPASAETGLP